MKRIGLLIFALLLFAGYQQAAAQSDVELTDSISNEWGGDTGGGMTPIIPSTPVTSLTISQTSITIEGGESYKLVAKTNSDAGNKKIAWSIEDKNIAYVTSNGTVRGLKTGTTVVTATSVSNPDLTASCRVTVTSDYVAIASGWILPWGKEEAWEMSYLYYEQSKYKEPIPDSDGNNWKELDYNDSAWRTLTGPMGSPGTTYSSYNYEWKGEYNCFCLRRTFTLPTVGQGVYTFRMQHDDDIVVYLNGAEVIYETGWTDDKISTYTIPSNKFIVGENILAIFIKQNHGGAFLDYSLYYERAEKPSDKFDIGFLPDVSFEFFYDAKSYDVTTQSIPNHEAANLAGYNLKLTANIPSLKNGNYLSLEKRCEGYIDRWTKGATESGAYFFRSGRDCMTIVCKVKPKMNSGNTSDLISNRGGGYNYMFRVGDHNSFFLHTNVAYSGSRAIGLPGTDAPQVLAVRVDGNNDYIQLDNFTTGESLRIPSIAWGGNNNIMKFFYNDNNEYYTGDVYWMYYSKNYVADEDLRGLVSYGLRKNYNITYIVDGEIYKVERVEEGTPITPITPHKEGYTFSGWSGLPQTMPAKDVTVTGEFTVNTYKLTYVVDGAVYKTVSVKYGETIVPIENQTKDGYTFNGWKGEDEVSRPIDIAGNSDNMLYSNAYCTMPGDEFIGWHVLFDNDPNTFFHSEWSSTNNSTDGLEHYLRVDLGVGSEIEKFSFTYTNRGNLSDGAPKTIVIEGSNIADGEYAEITTLTDLPGGKADVYKSDVIGNGNKYRFIRFRVTETQMNRKHNEHPFFYISEFGMTEHAYFIPKTMPAKDITVTGSFTVNTYNLIYMLDGKEYKRIPVKYGETITPETAPAKEGHTFSGWSGLHPTMPAMDVTVTGEFTVNTYKLTYVVDGEVYKTVSMKYGETITSETSPTKEGYSFGGWSGLPSIMPAKDVTVTGSFTVNTYKLTYMVDGEVYKTVSVKYGDTITPEPEPTKEGFIFSGWNGLPTTMPAKDIIVTGTFGTAQSYNITYIVDGEVYATGKTVYGEKIQLIEEPTKEGHTFSGWSEVPETMPAKDITVTGTFTVNTYKITYIVDGEVYTTIDVKYGETITAVEEPAKEGHTFSGWNGLLETMPAKDITVTGTFTVNTYKITYIVDGEVYTTVDVKYGETITAVEEPAKEGHTFSGWSEVPETMPAGDITVTGTFSVNYYNVIYIVDGEVYETVSTAYGDEIVLIDEPTKDGYKFSGWSEAPDRMPAEDVLIIGSFEYTDIDSPTVEEVGVDVYSLQGILLYKGIKELGTIPTGIYIINRRVVFIK